MADGLSQGVAGEAEAPLQGTLRGELLTETLHARQGGGGLPHLGAGGGGDPLSPADALAPGRGETAGDEVGQPAPQLVLPAFGVAQGTAAHAAQGPGVLLDAR